jgi:hypothetical protein
MVNVGIFSDHLENFMAIWYNLWLFGIICGHLWYFSRFDRFGQIKIWQPWSYLCILGQTFEIRHGHFESKRVDFSILHIITTSLYPGWNRSQGPSATKTAPKDYIILPRKCQNSHFPYSYLWVYFRRFSPFICQKLYSQFCDNYFAHMYLN